MNSNTREGGERKSIAVAVDNNKYSQYALKWAIDHLNTRDRVIKLVHVQVLHQRSQFSPTPSLFSFSFSPIVWRIWKQKLTFWFHLSLGLFTYVSVKSGFKQKLFQKTYPNVLLSASTKCTFWVLKTLMILLNLPLLFSCIVL